MPWNCRIFTAQRLLWTPGGKPDLAAALEERRLSFAELDKSYPTTHLFAANWKRRDASYLRGPDSGL